MGDKLGIFKILPFFQQFDIGEQKRLRVRLQRTAIRERGGAGGWWLQLQLISIRERGGAGDLVAAAACGCGCGCS
jgi:hypothetical protein